MSLGEPSPYIATKVLNMYFLKLRLARASNRIYQDFEDGYLKFQIACASNQVYQDFIGQSWRARVEALPTMLPRF